jgi:hypothetical protein
MTSIKSIIVIAIIILGMAATITYLYNNLKRVRADRDAYKNNTYGLMTGIEKLKTDSTKQAYQIQSLSLTLDEYKTYRAEDLKTIKSLDLKLKNVTSISKQTLEVQADLHVPIVEKPILLDSVIAQSQTVSLHNEHIQFDRLPDD